MTRWRCAFIVVVALYKWCERNRRYVRKRHFQKVRRVAMTMSDNWVLEPDSCFSFVMVYGMSVHNGTVQNSCSFTLGLQAII